MYVHPETGATLARYSPVTLTPPGKAVITLRIALGITFGISFLVIYVCVCICVFRSSQPMPGKANARNKQDEEMMQKLRALNVNTSGSGAGSEKEKQAEGQSEAYMFVDCRPHIAAVGNKVMGKGFEKISNYGNGFNIQFMNMENIHSVRGAHEKLIELLDSPDAQDSENFLIRLVETKYLMHIRAILAGAVFVAELLHDRKER